MSWNDPDLIYDEQGTAEETLVGVSENIPGWAPRNLSPMASLVEAFAIGIATAAVQFREEYRSAYEGFGSLVLGRPRLQAAVASALSEWTLGITTGLTIPGGTAVTATAPTGQTIDFVVPADVVVPSGVSVVSEVQLVAVDAGPEPNGTAGTAVCETVIGVDSITITVPAAGGAEEEDPDTYLDIVSDRARRMRALPITPADYAAMALDVGGIDRAYAVNRYDPAVPATDSPGHVTVFGFDDAGGSIADDSTTGIALAAYFDAEEKVLQPTVHIAAAPTVAITVVATLKAELDADQAALHAQAIANIQAHFDRSQWDRDDKRPNKWKKKASTEVTSFEVSAAIDDLPGLRKVTALTLNAGSSVALGGPLSIPVLSGTPTITVIT